MTFVIFAFTFILAVLSTAYWAWFVTGETLFAPLRKKLQLKNQFLDDLFHCHWCIGFHIALVFHTAPAMITFAAIGAAPWWTLYFALPINAAVTYTAARLVDSQ